MRFKLTGEAENPIERAEKRTFEVLDRCLDDHGGGAHLVVKASDGEVKELEIAPWVKVILIPKAQA